MKVNVSIQIIIVNFFNSILADFLGSEIESLFHFKMMNIINTVGYSVFSFSHYSIMYLGDEVLSFSDYFLGLELL